MDLMDALPSLIAQSNDIPISQLEEIHQAEYGHSFEREYLGLKADEMYRVGYSEEQVTKVTQEVKHKEGDYRNTLELFLLGKAYEKGLYRDE